MTNTNGRTLREAYVQASSFLAAAGVDEAQTSARRLLALQLGIPDAELLWRFPEPFPPEAEARWQELLQRRAAGEPLQYIVGEQEFYGLPFAVSPAVLIPRPETELLVEAIVRHGQRMWPPGGAEPVASADRTAAAVQCPGWEVAAVDLSPEALAVAQANAEQNGAAERIRWLQGDLLLPVIESGLAPDILVSNPPYIPSADIPGLQREVRQHEPLLALDGGSDGLTPYRRMAEQLAQLPAWPRLVGFEVGQGQADEVAELMRATGRFEWIEIVPDYAGIPRHVLAGRG
ncbi:peptide chain release factor N(5)-glutamine methyltransferase [Gorillibacterium timonense]|uniref:peptide chain release factor N(5)-glutamine methyltransferase n=1 Tax=Gorillibacterium timonense TaxID=1689269 RepID=UPI00071CA85F|nr:peptide chain release factor N(5)-glutamine methyltransferase [Gorillibacterium timonense]